MGAPDASSRRTFSSSATAPPPTAGCPTAAVAADDARASAGAVMFEEVKEAEGSSESAHFPGRGKSGTPVRHQYRLRTMYAHLQVYGDSVNTTTLWRQACDLDRNLRACRRARVAALDDAHRAQEVKKSAARVATRDCARELTRSRTHAHQPQQ